jgi:WD40 repeat protein
VYSADGKWIACPGSYSQDPGREKEQLTVSLYDASTGRRNEKLQAVAGRWTTCSFSADSEVLVTTRLLWWTGQRYRYSAEVWNLKTMTRVRETELECEGKLFPVGVTKDNRRVIAAATDYSKSEGQIVSWDLTTGKIIAIPRNGWGTFTTAPLFLPDGKRFAIGGSERGGADSVIYLVEADSFTVRSVLRGHLGLIGCLALTPDGTLLASGSEDTTVLLWPIPKS